MSSLVIAYFDPGISSSDGIFGLPPTEITMFLVFNFPTFPFKLSLIEELSLLTKSQICSDFGLNITVFLS